MGSDNPGPDRPDTPDLEVPRQVLDAMLEGVQVIDRQFRYLYVNDALVRHGRTSRQALLGKTMAEAYPGIESTTVFGLIHEVMTGREARQLENEFTFPDGTRGWFELRIEPVPSGVVVLSVDITERKRAERRVRTYSARLERLARVVRHLARATSFGAIVELVRTAARDLTAADGAAFILRDGDLCHYVDEDAIAPLWKGRRVPMSQCVSGWVIREARPATVTDVLEAALAPADLYRETFVKSLAVVPIRSEQPLGAIGAYWARHHAPTAEELRLLRALADSTSVALANLEHLEQLRERERRVRAIYDNLPNATFVWSRRDDRLALTGFNAVAARITAERAQALVGHSPEAWGAAVPHLADDLRHCGTSGASITREVTALLPGTDTPRTLILTYGPIPPDLVLMHVDDVTERRHTEAQLRHAQRLEAIGHLAGGIAHDFNNLLSVILSYTGFALEGLPAGSPVREDLVEVHHAGERAALLTRQLLAFSRKQVLSPTVLNLNRVVRDIERMLRRILGSDITIAVDLAEDLGNTSADPGQLEQVLMNLAVNARDAMPEGGRLSIETANVDLDEEYASQHVEVRPGPFVMLSVSDSGCGMEPTVKERIFEPFFTTKTQGRGTGLGLSTVYGIVRQSGGNIWVYSEPGCGTTFKVYLPRVDAPLSPSAPSASLTLARGEETALIVEDQEQVRRLAQRILESAGYRVLIASSGDEALALALNHSGRLDLLLTDVIMPEMSGLQLATTLRVTRPELRILFMSGFADLAVTRQGIIGPDADFVGKPFTASELTRKVRETLDRPPTPSQPQARRMAQDCQE